MTAETDLPDGALVLLARAGLDLNVLETEMKRIETTCNDQEGAS